MTFRELMRYESWSKRTTRKIFLCLGIAFGLTFLGFAIWHQIDVRWLTTGERNAAKAALGRIDALDGSSPLSFDEYVNLTKRAEMDLQAANAAAKTSKDQIVVMTLIGYFAEVVSEQSAAQRQRLIEQGRLSPASRKYERDRNLDSRMHALKLIYHRNLHDELD
jgi:hypothetical protein